MKPISSVFNFRPVFSFETGLTTHDYGCGPCPEVDAACEECDGTKCNVELVLGEDYKCADYKWVAADSKFAADDAAMTTCKSLKDTAQNQCNK